MVISLPHTFWNRILSHHRTFNSYTYNNTNNSFPYIHTRSINGYIGSSPLYLSFFQRKHYYQTLNTYAIQPHIYRKRNKVQGKIQQQHRGDHISSPIINSSKEGEDMRNILWNAKNIIIYVSPQQDIFLHSLRNGYPVCVLYHNSLGSNKDYEAIRSYEPIHTTFFLPLQSSSRMSNDVLFINRKRLPTLIQTHILLDSAGMTLSIPATDDKASITFPLSAIALPSLLDINGDGAMDLILVPSKTGYFLYHICVRKVYGLDSSPIAVWMLVALLYLVILSAAMYNHYQTKKHNTRGRWMSESRMIRWIGLRSSEKVE